MNHEQAIYKIKLSKTLNYKKPSCC